MVRGLRPRDCIRAVVDAAVRSASTADAVGHAQWMQRKGERGGGLPRGNDAVCRPTDGAPGTVRPTRRDVTFSNKPTPSVIQRKGRRGRRPLRWVRDAGISIVVNRCASAASLHPPLGSPERGAVTALCAVTEGLVQGRCDVIKLSVNQGRAGVEDKPPAGCARRRCRHRGKQMRKRRNPTPALRRCG